MRYHVLACDYDGTIARDGVVDQETLSALERVKASGRKLLLVTGRELDDLARIFSRLDVFDRVVAENGAVLYSPRTRETRTLVDAPPPEFVEALRARGVGPISVGQVIVATREPHEAACLDVIRSMGLELHIVFNKGAVMILPSGCNKALGLAAALEELRLSPHNVVGVGDAENDHAFLAQCECAAAVANALPTLKERADVVMTGDHGMGVQELAARLVDTDLREVTRELRRHALVLGTREDGSEVLVHPYEAPVLLAGTSGGGKSMLATSLLEQLVERGYQICILDPEGDYVDFEGATTLGDAKRAPGVTEVLDVLDAPKQNAVVNLLGVPLADRPATFAKVLAALVDLRARTGRPHWIVLDEAHHLANAELDRRAFVLPPEPHGMLFITVHPRHVSPALLATVKLAIAIGQTPRETLAELAMATGEAPPVVSPDPLGPGEAIAWFRGCTLEPLKFRSRAPRSEHQRHVRKYATGEMRPESWFFFRGPEGKLRLKVQNLQTFVQIADGVDADTWSFHLREGDYTRWFREAVGDAQLADLAETVRQANLPPDESRARIRAAIEQRYTAPA